MWHGQRSSQLFHAAGQHHGETSGSAQPTLGEKIKSVIPGTDAHRAKQEHSGYGELLTAWDGKMESRRQNAGGQLLLTAAMREQAQSAQAALQLHHCLHCIALVSLHTQAQLQAPQVHLGRKPVYVDQLRSLHLPA